MRKKCNCDKKASSEEWEWFNKPFRFTCNGCDGGVKKPVKATRYFLHEEYDSENIIISWRVEKLDGHWHKNCLKQKRFLSLKEARLALIKTIPE